MALTDDAPRRPEARPEALAPEQTRPRLRPESLAANEEAEATLVAEADTGTRPRLRPDGLGSVPNEVQEAATLAEAIPLDETALIGLFNSPDGGSALVRLRTGRIVRVATGETVDGGRVVAINEDGLRLQRGDDQVVLTMPG